MNRKQLFAIFLGLAAGLFLLAAPALAVDCPTDNGSGVGCLDPGSPYYCGGACRSGQTQCTGGWTPSPICASGFACANFQEADLCGYGKTCASGYTRCGAWPNYTCPAIIAPVSPCNHYDTCNNYCDGCITGYTLCGSTHVCVANLTCLPGQTFNPCTNACEGAVSMLKLGYDSVSDTNIIQSTTYPTLYIPSSENVGIGTSAPGQKLTIAPLSGYALIAGLSTSTAYRIGNVSAPIDDFDAATKAYVDSVAPGGSLSLWNGTQDGNIWNGTNGTGNVGIGTTAPGYPLEIRKDGIGAAYVNAGLTISNTTAATSGLGQDASIILAGKAWDGSASVDTQWALVGHGSNNNNNIFSIYHKRSGVWTQILGIDSFSQFSSAIYEATWDTRQTYVPRFNLKNDATATASYNQFSPSLRFYSRGWDGSVGTKYTAWELTSEPGTGSGDPVANLTFRYGINSQTSTTEAMRIQNGNVGIGTTAPGAKLEVDAASGYAILAGSSTSTAFRIGNVSAPVDDSDAATKGYVDAVAPGGSLSLWNGTQNGNIWNGTDGTGNVGIGTTNPVVKFQITDVSGGIFFSGAASNYNRFKSTASSASAGKDLLFSAQNSGNTPDLYIKSNGNVGIGTTNPTVLLHLEKAANVNLLAKTTATDQYAELKLANDNNVGLFNRMYSSATVGTHAGINRANSAAIMTQGSNMYFGSAGTGNIPMYFGTTDTAYMTITSGNVGIGTTAPGAKLEVDATTGYAILAGSSALTAYRIGNVSVPIDDFDAATKGYVDAVAPGGSLSLWNGTQNGNIWNGTSGAGKVGIGTTAPDQKLEVSGVIKATNSSTYRWYADYYIGTISGSPSEPILILLETFNGSYEYTFGRVIAKRSGSNAGNMSDIEVSSYKDSTSLSRNAQIRAVYMPASQDPKLVRATYNGVEYTAIEIQPNSGVRVPDSWIFQGYHYSTGADSLKVVLKSEATGVIAFSSWQTPMYKINQGNFIVENGNVGIGTTAPKSYLDVNGDIAFGTTSYGNNIYQGYASLGSNRSSQATILGNNIKSTVSAVSSIMRNPSGSDPGNFIKLRYDKGITFHTNITTALNAVTSEDTGEVMRIGLSGNVGIGTTAPNAKLEINPASGYAILAGFSTSTAYRIGNVDTPVADNDAATKAYVDAGIATATSSIATVAHYVGATPATYNGANSGTSGYTYAHSLCAAAYAGSHVCTTYEMLDTIQATPANIPTETVWIFNGPPGYTAPSNDCDGRTNSTTAYGAVWHINVAYPQGRGMITLCNNANKLACCK